MTEHPAQRWARVWELAWDAGDAEAAAALYALDCVFRSAPFREPEAPLSYVTRVFPEARAEDVRFGEPVEEGDRAAVEWWATLVEDGREITLAGLSWLRFDEGGLVSEQRDYWTQHEGRTPPPEAWGD